MTPAPTPRLTVTRAHAALMWERAARVAWPAAAFPGLFIVLALVGFWARVGDPLRAIALLVALAAGVLYALRGARGARWPSREDARRRVEEDSGFASRPFEALSDHPVESDPNARALWRAHQGRMRARLKGARARRPRAAFAAADRFALRGVLLIGVIAGAIAAGGEAGRRLSDAFSPRALVANAPNMSAEAWVEAPGYTNRAPLFLGAQGDGDAAPVAPAGSVLTVRVSGAGRPPRLTVTDASGARREALQADGPGLHTLGVELRSDADVRVTGSARSRWRIVVAADQPPAVDFATSPHADALQAIAFTYDAADDYGVTDLEFRVTLDDSDETFASPLQPPSATAVEAQAASLDLTEHPWAGRSVEVQLVARDAIGQAGYSDAIAMTLPEKLFIEPLARAIAEQRVALIRDGAGWAAPAPAAALSVEDVRALPPFAVNDLARRLERAPEGVRRVRRALDLLAAGADIFARDYAVQLALTYVSERLALAHRHADIGGLQDVLWDAALRAEAGDLGDAERALRAAERALADALARGADQAEIDRLMEDYREAVNRYMAALSAQALADGRVMQGGGGAGDAMEMTDLQDLLDALEDLTSTGADGDARRVLAALTAMLRNMELTLTTGGSGEGEELENSELNDALEELGELISRQRELMDQTFDENEGRDGAETSDEDAGDIAGRQGELRDDLNAVAGATGELGEPGDENAADGAEALDEAGDAMGDAQGALRDGRGDSALRAQGRALERLREAAEALSRQALDEERERAGIGEDDGQAGESGRDPFGRRTGGSQWSDGAGVDVPDEAERQRAREILDELRRRAGETERDGDELGYVRRLLERF